MVRLSHNKTQWSSCVGALSIERNATGVSNIKFIGDEMNRYRYTFK